MSWRLLALDLDGTLLEEDQRILPELIERLTRLAHDGRQIAIASGRPEQDVQDLLRTAGAPIDHLWPGLFVANERDIYIRGPEGFLPDEEWNDRLQRMEADNLPSIRRVVEAWLGVQPDRDQFHHYDEEAVEDQRCIIALCSPNLDRAMLAQKELTRLFDLQGLPIQVFRNRSIMVFRHSEISKGRTLLRAVKQADVAPGEVLAIGDSDNDRAMLNGEFDFRSACPANAEPAIQELVRANNGYVAALPNGRGVLEILDHVA